MLNTSFIVSLPELFVSGGTFFMLLVSLLLIALLVAAWKAPRWVKEIGLAALVVGIFSTMLGLVYDDENQMEFIGLWWGLHLFAKCILPLVVGGLMVCLICPMYGMIVYFISLVIRVIQKPRA